eukprot:7841567-Ditylum_brightwellii.AAC.1
MEEEECKAKQWKLKSLGNGASICGNTRGISDKHKQAMPTIRGYVSKKEHSTVLDFGGIMKLPAIWTAPNAHLHMDPGEANSANLNKQMQHAIHMLAHSMSHSDSALFTMSLFERIQTSKAAKIAWLVALQIADKDYIKVHERTPG